MGRLKSILLYLIFSCPFILLAVETDLYKNYDHKNYRQNAKVQKLIDIHDVNYDLLNAAVFFRTNEVRVKLGRNPLSFHMSLFMAAQMHASDMIAHDFFSHTNHFNSVRENPSDRYVLCRVDNPMAAENIANTFAIKYKANTSVYVIDAVAGLFSYNVDGDIIEQHSYLSFAETLVELWMNSEGHRANILRDTAVELGCACVFYRDKMAAMPKFMCVQNFQLYNPIVLRNL